MITFNVVKEQNGWAIRTSSGMTTPYRTQDAAMHEAECLAEAIRGHGECVEVIVEYVGPSKVSDKRKFPHPTIANILMHRRLTGSP